MKETCIFDFLQIILTQLECDYLINHSRLSDVKHPARFR